MTDERTFVLAYPCHCTYASVGEIVSKFEKLNFKITEMGCIHVNEAFAQVHVDAVGLDPENDMLPYGNLVYYLASNPVVAMIVEGEGVISKVCALISDKQHPFWATKGIETVYASSTYEEAEKDISRWFDSVDLEKKMEQSKKVVYVLPDKVHGPLGQVEERLKKDRLIQLQPDLKGDFYMDKMCVFLINPLAFKERCVGEILGAIENNCCIKGIKLVRKKDCPSELWTSGSLPSDRGVAVVGYLVESVLNITAVDPIAKDINYMDRVFNIGSKYVQQSEMGKKVLEHATNFFKSGFSVWARPGSFSLGGCMFEASIVGLVDPE
ncbi:hypothetical protein C5167_003698 [Papaver somniferum]|uniref:nucleoside-diphosphate kinase n=1 Tax=Papaver somniferum TaxID=3469 RepID=A0A4Y7L2R0_PAPSO|nr:uncharacterized protein LOC113314362 [Papaver somniferum]RZC79476.1 hypothetical protein C5167_003698 [Papaver somniferum]